MWREGCTLGWSDLALFAIFEKQHLSADQVNFLEFSSKILATSVMRARSKLFIIKKFTGPLKLNIFFENLHRRRTFATTKKFEIKIKWAKRLLISTIEKQILLVFLLTFSL